MKEAPAAPDRLRGSGTLPIASWLESSAIAGHDSFDRGFMPDIESQPGSTAELYCPACGYDLRGIESPRCPECGDAIDRSSLGLSTLPWLHRKRLGRFRAFWRTVHLAMFRPRMLARDMNCPANLADAVKFRRMVVLHALIPFGLAWVVLWFAAPAIVSGDIMPNGLAEALAWTGFFESSALWDRADITSSLLQLATLAFGWLCLASFFWGMTGSAAYFFHPTTMPIIRQNRAVALSYYASAPLVYLPWTLLVACIVLILPAAIEKIPLLMAIAIMITGCAALIWNIVLLIRVPIVLLVAATHCTASQQVSLGFALPVLWLFWALITLVVLPAVWLAAVIMGVSLYL